MSRVTTTITGKDDLSPVLKRAEGSVNQFASKTQASINKVVPATTNMNKGFSDAGASIGAVGAASTVAGGNIAGMGGIISGMPAIMDTMGLSATKAGRALSTAMATALGPILLITAAIGVVISIIGNWQAAQEKQAAAEKKAHEDRLANLKKEQAAYSQHYNRLSAHHADYLDLIGLSEEAAQLRLSDARSKALEETRKPYSDLVSRMNEEILLLKIAKHKLDEGTEKREKANEIREKENELIKAKKRLENDLWEVNRKFDLKREQFLKASAQNTADAEQAKRDAIKETFKARQKAHDDEVKLTKKLTQEIRDLHYDLDTEIRILGLKGQDRELAILAERHIKEHQHALDTIKNEQELQVFLDKLFEKHELERWKIKDKYAEKKAEVDAAAAKKKKASDKKAAQDQDKRNETNLDKLVAAYKKRKPDFTPKFESATQVFQRIQVAAATRKTKDPTLKELQEQTKIMGDAEKKEDKWRADMITGLGAIAAKPTTGTFNP